MKMDAVIAANRFGLGARPGELKRADANPRRWLLDQLQGPSRRPAELDELSNTASALVEVQEARRERNQARKAAKDDPQKKMANTYGRTVRRHYAVQAEARYRLASRTDQPFYERLVHFWSNHFAVSADKQPMPAVAGLFEQEAIRPNVAGNFARLLIAAEQHPSMIMYLDNQRSVGPDSELARRDARSNRVRDRNIGLNENLAREILELHTLGVDGPYTQEDVTTFARVITGWSIGGSNNRKKSKNMRRRLVDGKPGTFHFRREIHDLGTKHLLGKRYSEVGMRQGIAVMLDLALHPSTARFLATKLTRHFVADNPDPRLVDKMAAAYLESGGELSAMYETLISAPEAWSQTFAKYKSPHDFVISTFRAFDYVPDRPQFVVSALDTLGQAPYKPGSPAGWPDTAEEWGGADALYKRVEWSNTVARFAGKRANPVEVGNAVLGPAFSTRTRKAVSRAESLTQGLTLFLASPDFQRR